MVSRILQLRNAFGLDDTEELYGQFSCAHTRPRWGSQFLQGQLYVFSTVLVFHANLLAVIKVERINFKDVRVIRKRSFMRMPNTIAVVRDAGKEGVRDDVFTSFLFASRKKAFEVMVARWRAVNPEAADTYLASVTSGGLCDNTMSSSSSFSCNFSSPDLLSSSSSGMFGRQSRRTAASAGPVGASGAAGVGAGGPPPFPAWREVSDAAAAALLAAPDGMTHIVGAQIPCGSTKLLAEVLLSDLSGFLPAVYKAQGNELVSLTPWQVSSGRQPCAAAPHLPQPPGSLSRTLHYIYSSSGPWGSVRSLVVQEQLLLLGPQGHVVLIITQRMPDLPAGAGKCFYITIRWDITPTQLEQQQQPAAAAADPHPMSPHTPHATAAAAGGLDDAAAAATGDAEPPADGVTSAPHPQQQLDTYDRSPFCDAPAMSPDSDTAAAAAAADDDNTGSSSCVSPLRVLPLGRVAVARRGSSSSGSSSGRDSISSEEFAGSPRASMLRQQQQQHGNSSVSSFIRGLSPGRQREQSANKTQALNHCSSQSPSSSGGLEVVEKLPAHLTDVVTVVKSGFKQSYKLTKQATKKGLRELQKSAKSVSAAAAPLSALTLINRKSLDKPALAAAAAAANAGEVDAAVTAQGLSFSAESDTAAAAAVSQITQLPGPMHATPMHAQRQQQQQQQGIDGGSSTSSVAAQPPNYSNCSTPTAAGAGAASDNAESPLSFGVKVPASSSSVTSTPTLTPVGPLHLGLGGGTPSDIQQTGPLAQGLKVRAALGTSKHLVPQQQQQQQHWSAQQQQQQGGSQVVVPASPTSPAAASLYDKFGVADAGVSESAPMNPSHSAPQQQQQQQILSQPDSMSALQLQQEQQKVWFGTLCDTSSCKDQSATTANAQLTTTTSTTTSSSVHKASASAAPPNSAVSPSPVGGTVDSDIGETPCAQDAAAAAAESATRAFAAPVASTSGAAASPQPGCMSPTASFVSCLADSGPLPELPAAAAAAATPAVAAAAAGPTSGAAAAQRDAGRPLIHDDGTAAANTAFATSATRGCLVKQAPGPIAEGIEANTAAAAAGGGGGAAAAAANNAVAPGSAAAAAAACVPRAAAGPIAEGVEAPSGASVTAAAAGASLSAIPEAVTPVTSNGGSSCSNQHGSSGSPAAKPGAAAAAGLDAALPSVGGLSTARQLSTDEASAAAAAAPTAAQADNSGVPTNLQDKQLAGQHLQETLAGSGSSSTANTKLAAAAAGSSAPRCAECSGGGVQWQIHASVTFTKWHMMQSKIERDCLTTAKASLQDIVEQGTAWLQDEQRRVSLAEVMPQAAAAAAAVAAAAAQRHGGGRPVRPSSHRRSGSAGSSGGLRLASSGGAAGSAHKGTGSGGAHVLRSNSSSSIKGMGSLVAGSGFARAGGGGAARGRGFAAKTRQAVASFASFVVSAVLPLLFSIPAAFLQAAVTGTRAAGQMWQSPSSRQVLVGFGLVVVLAVQLLLMWRVVALQSQMVQLLQQACTSKA